MCCDWCFHCYRPAQMRSRRDYTGFFLSQFLFRLLPMALVVTIFATLSLPDFVGALADPVFSNLFVAICHRVQSRIQPLRFLEYFWRLPMNLGWKSKLSKYSLAHQKFN